MEWLLWIDIETSGLDVDHHNILQIACILTDFHLTIQHVFGQITIKQPLDKWDPWCIEQHTASGLMSDVQNSTTTLADAERSIIGWLNSFLAVKDTVYIAGNSVHFDKRFIDKYMPMLASRLSYKIVDVTSLGIVCKHIDRAWYDKRPEKRYSHTALADIIESTKEYKHYLDKP
jgi:oligoribonuclease